MLQAFIVTLREGVEAALIVGITLAYLAKIGRDDLRKTVYAALGAAFLGSIGVAVVISRLNLNEDVFEGWVMLVAAFFVVTMVIFMMKTGRKLKGEIEGKVGLLAGNDAWVGLFFFIFLMLQGRCQRVLEDGFLGTFGGFTGFFLAWTYTRLEPVWIGLALAVLLPFVHEVSRFVRPNTASLDFGRPGNLVPTRWNWLLIPFPFGIGYEMLTWVCWVPLASRWTPTQDLPFLEGRLIAFAGFRMGAVFTLALLCFAFMPRARWRETIVVAAIAGAAASALDRFCWGWFSNHGGLLAALFGIPALAGGTLIFIDRFIRKRGAREATA